MASEVLVCVLGPSRGQGHVFKSGEGVGKSCLCYRFLHPGFDDFISEHPSILAGHEFQSPAVNSVHWLYWGCNRQSLPARLGKGERSVEIHVVENTVLYEDVTSKPFRGSGGKADNIDAYMKRALSSLESPGKISYWTRDGISLPDTYRPQRYPTNGGRMRRGFAVVVDVSLDGMEFDAQLQRTKVICKHLKKADVAYMLVATKVESVVQESLEKLQNMKKKGADIITTSAMCNYNIAASFKIIAEKILKTVYVNIPTFEQAAENELTAKTSAKRLFKNFTTKWVQASTERIEDVERTEQYRSCKSTIGKYETDRIFAFKLLEVKNSEMMVGVNEDPERRLEYLEDFIQMHPDLMLYQSQLVRKVQDHVAESLLELPSSEKNSTASSSPRTPRRVLHYPASDEGSKHSSTANSPALKHHQQQVVDPPERQLSTASAVSVGSSSAPDISEKTNDNQSLGSFDSDDELDYMNMQGFSKGKGLSTLPPTTLSPDHTHSPTLPLPIPPLESHDPVATGNEEEPGNKQVGERKPRSSSTHEWVSLPQTPPISAGSVGKAAKEEGPSRNETTEDIRDAQSEDGIAGGDEDEVGGLEPARSEEILYQNTATDGPSGNGTVTAECAESQEILYQNTAREPWDGPSEDGAIAGQEAGEDTLPLKDASMDEAIPVLSTLPPCPSDITAAPPKLLKPPPEEANTSSDPPMLLPTKPSSTTKPKPPPPPRKPKPKRAKKPSAVDDKKTDDNKVSAPPSAPDTLPPPPSSPPKTSPTTSNSSLPPISIEDLRSSLGSKIKLTTGIPLPAQELELDDDECSSGEEYIPSEYEDEDGKIPYLRRLKLKEEMRVMRAMEKRREMEEMEEKREPTPEQDPAPTSLPPPIPTRTKNYHLVVLDKERTKKEVPKPSAAASSTAESSPSPQTSPAKTAVGKQPQSSPSAGESSASTDKDTGKADKKRKWGYEAWKMKKREKTRKSPSEPKSPVSPTKERKKKRKNRKPLKHSQSDRHTAHKKTVRRAPSDASVPMGPGEHRSLPREPRTTFLNMKTRPLPDAPFALPHEEPAEHTLDDYDLVDVMLPSSHMLPPREVYPPVSPVPSPRSQQGPQVPPLLPPSSSSSTQQRWQTHSLSADNMDYLNGDEFPRSATVHPFSVGPSHSPAASYPLPPSLSPRARVAGQPPAGGWNPSPTQSLPPSSQPLFQVATEPAHPAGIPYPLPPSARQRNHAPSHIPLGRSISNPHRNDDPPSPDYSYPKIPGLGLMLPSRGRGATHIGSVPRSKSTEFNVDDDYVQMKLSTEDENDDQHYQNFDVIESIRATKRSKSMEDLHLYQNFPSSPDTPTVFDRTLPLPGRGVRQRFVLPPRNLPRWQPPPRNIIQQQQLSGSSWPASHFQQEVSPVKSLPGSMHHFPQQVTSSSATPVQPWLSPRPTLKNQPARPARISDPSLHPAAPPSSLSHTRHVITTTSPPLSEITCELPPHLEYVPKYKSRTAPPQPTSPSSVGPVAPKMGPNFKPPVEPPVVGTSTWTADDDPMADYYNVVSKSFLFSRPKSLSPQDNSYLDILPD